MTVKALRVLIVKLQIILMNMEPVENEDDLYFVKAIQIIVAEIKLYRVGFQEFLNGFSEPEFEYRPKSHCQPVNKLSKYRESTTVVIWRFP